MRTQARKLPRTAQELVSGEYLPEYLRETENFGGEIFSDIFSEQVDWGRFEALRVGWRPTVTVGSTTVELLGVVHSSGASAEAVKRRIAEFAPEVVALESDEERTAMRRKFQVPELPKTAEGSVDWRRATDETETATLQRTGVIERSFPAEKAEFLKLVGSFAGAPEITAIVETERLGIELKNVDVLEKVKRMQNVSLSELSMSSKRIGEISDSISRLVVDDQDILRFYQTQVFGKFLGNAPISPSLLYRICELNERSSPAEDFLLREIHRVCRPKQFFTRVWLRDVYMAARIRELCETSTSPRRLLVICGAAHVEGIREILESPLPLENLVAVSLAALIVDGNLFLHVWRDLFHARLFDPQLPRLRDPLVVKFALFRRLLGRQLAAWKNNRWEIFPGPLSDEALPDHLWRDHAATHFAPLLDALWKGQVCTHLQ